MRIDIRPVSASSEHVAALADLLVETVATGGSVSFMHPLPPEEAMAFWSTSLADAEKGRRIVLGAFDRESLVGTVTLLMDFPPNQPHRAEIAKLMTAGTYRGRGIATALMREAEALAVKYQRTLIVLDTAAEEGAAAFYDKLGYTRAGEIPDFAYKPHGGLTPTVLYWKRLGQHVAPRPVPER